MDDVMSAPDLPRPGLTADATILGIDFGGTKVAIGLARADGSLVETRRLETDASAGAVQAVNRALSAAASLAAGAAVAAVGVVSPGIVLPEKILLAPNVPGWEELRLQDMVAAAFPSTPAVVGTDAKAAALAEGRWGALVDADPGIFLSVGTGLAAAVIIGGRVLAGANGAAGEIGYNLRGVSDVGGHAVGSASLEEAVAGRGLGERATALLGRPMTAAQLFASGDPAARALLDSALDELAVHVANLAIAVDPARIAVGGGLTGSADVLLPPLRARLAQAVPFPPELVTARFDQDGALRGAVALALDHVGAGVRR